MRVSLLAVVVSLCVGFGAVVACVGDDTSAPVGTPDGDAGAKDDGPSSSSDGAGGQDGAGGDSSSGGCTATQVECNGACVETATFQTNAKSCGACGHDCLGATCSAGKCAALPIFTSVSDAATVEPVRNIVVDTTDVYFTAAQGPNGGGAPGLYSCAIAGCASPTLLQAGNTFGLAITPNAPTRILFSIPQDDVVLRYSPAGSGGDRSTSCSGNEKLCRLSGFPQSNGITTDGTNAYWGTGVPGPGGFFGSNAYKVAVPNGGTAIDLGMASTAGTPISMVSAALDPDDATKKYLYMADSTGDGGRVLVFSTSGTPAPIVLAGSGSTTGVASVIVKNGLVYWASKTGVYSTPVCPTAGCPAMPPMPVKVYAIANATAVVADATKLYFAAGATVSSCPFASCTTPKPLFEGATANVLALTQDTNAIYMGDDHGNVARVAK